MAWAGRHRVFGDVESPYTMKLRAYMRHKGIPFDFIPHMRDGGAEWKQHARIPIIPTLVTPEGTALQDSTLIVEGFEAQQPEPSVRPPAPLRFLDDLLEEWGDEWVDKWMFHYRWYRPLDQEVVSRRMVARLVPPEQVEKAAAGIRKRQVSRIWVCGSNPRTAHLIEKDFVEAVGALERHLAARPYLFGTRPALADFSLGMQLRTMLMDPTPGGILRESAPGVVRYIDRVEHAPHVEGRWETWEALAPTLRPLLLHVRRFLTWSVANAAAVGSGAGELTVDLGDGIGVWWQKVAGPQKYQAKSFRALLKKYAAVRGDPQLRGILSAAGCLAPLEGRAQL